MGSNEEQWEPYDELVIATGATPFVPDAPGASARGIFGISSLQSGINVRKYIETEQPKSAVIVGGGYIGLEMAEALVAIGMNVSLVERGAQVMGSLDEDMAVLVSAALEEAGVHLYRQESLIAFETTAGKIHAVTTDKRTIPADMVILGMGVSPNSSLAAAAGIPLGAKGAIRVNERMQTEVPGIWAAGDCAESFHLVSRKPVFIPLGTIANKHGRVAGINLGGGYATFPGIVGTAVTKVCSVEVGRTGLHEKEIRQLGLEYVSAKIESKTKIGYFPDSGRITVKILAEKGSGRLLGGQIIGAPGSAKRIDAFAVALHARFNLEEMINLDLGYAPPFSPVWDAAHIAAREALKKI